MAGHLLTAGGLVGQHRQVQQFVGLLKLPAVFQHDGQVLQDSATQLLVADGLCHFQRLAVRRFGQIQPAGAVVDHAERHQGLGQRLAGAQQALLGNQYVQQGLGFVGFTEDALAGCILEARGEQAWFLLDDDAEESHGLRAAALQRQVHATGESFVVERVGGHQRRFGSKAALAQQGTVQALHDALSEVGALVADHGAPLQAAIGTLQAEVHTQGATFAEELHGQHVARPINVAQLGNQFRVGGVLQVATPAHVVGQADHAAVRNHRHAAVGAKQIADVTHQPQPGPGELGFAGLVGHWQHGDAGSRARRRQWLAQQDPGEHDGQNHYYSSASEEHGSLHQGGRNRFPGKAFRLRFYRRRNGIWLVPCCRHWRQLCNEAVAVAMDGLDDVLAVGVVIDRLSRLHDGTGQRGFGD